MSLSFESDEDLYEARKPSLGISINEPVAAAMLTSHMKTGTNDDPHQCAFHHAGCLFSCKSELEMSSHLRGRQVEHMLLMMTMMEGISQVGRQRDVSIDRLQASQERQDVQICDSEARWTSVTARVDDVYQELATRLTNLHISVIETRDEIMHTIVNIQQSMADFDHKVNELREKFGTRFKRKDSDVEQQPPAQDSLQTTAQAGPGLPTLEDEINGNISCASPMANPQQSQMFSHHHHGNQEQQLPASSPPATSSSSVPTCPRLRGDGDEPDAPKVRVNSSKTKESHSPRQKPGKRGARRQYSRDELLRLQTGPVSILPPAGLHEHLARVDAVEIIVPDCAVAIRRVQKQPYPHRWEDAKPDKKSKKQAEGKGRSKRNSEGSSQSTDDHSSLDSLSLLEYPSPFHSLGHMSDITNPTSTFSMSSMEYVYPSSDTGSDPGSGWFNSLFKSKSESSTSLPSPYVNPVYMDMAELTDQEVTEGQMLAKQILDSYIEDADVEAAVLSLKLLACPHWPSYFVYSATRYVLERPEHIRRSLGFLFHALIIQGLLTIQLYTDGLVELLECTGSSDVDMCVYAEFIGPLLFSGDIGIDFLATLSAPLETSKKRHLLVAEILKDVLKGSSKENVRKLWRESKMQWSAIAPYGTNIEKFLKQQKLYFTVPGMDDKPEQLSMEEIRKQLVLMIEQSQDSPRRVIKWIQSSLTDSQLKQPEFAAALMTAVCGSAIQGTQSPSVNTQAMKARSKILRKFITGNEPLEFRAIQALHELLNTLGYPKGLLKTFSDVLCNEGVMKHYGKEDINR